MAQWGRGQTKLRVHLKTLQMIITLWNIIVNGNIVQTMYIITYAPTYGTCITPSPCRI